MTLENILTIIDKFDSSESAYLELQMGEVNLKLKKAEACGQQAQGGLVVSEQPNQSGQTDTKADGMPQIHVDYIKAPLGGV